MNQIELIKIIKNITYGVHQDFPVETFTNGDVYALWNNNSIKYSAVNLAIEDITVNDNYSEYNIILYYGDRLLQDDSNFNFIQIDGEKILTEIIENLKNVDGIDVETPYTFVPFQQKFADYLGGVYVRLTLQAQGDTYCGEFVDLCKESSKKYEALKAHSFDFRRLGMNKSQTEVAIDRLFANELEIYDFFENSDLEYIEDIGDSFAGYQVRIFPNVKNFDKVVNGYGLCQGMSELRCFFPTSMRECINANEMFWGAGTNFGVELINLSLPNCENLDYTFYESNINRIRLTDLESVMMMNNTFENASINVIDLNFSTTSCIEWNNAFSNSRIEHIYGLDFSSADDTITNAFGNTLYLRELTIRNWQNHNLRIDTLVLNLDSVANILKNNIFENPRKLYLSQNVINNMRKYDKNYDFETLASNAHVEIYNLDGTLWFG